MHIRRLSSAALVIFAVVFVAANLVALPFASFGSYSALWAQVYGNNSSNIPTCTNGSDFVRLTDPQAQDISSHFPLPTTDAKMAAVFYTACFGVTDVALSGFTDGLTCDNAVAYRITVDGGRERWPIKCDAAGTGLLIPGTGEAGHIILYKIGDPGTAPGGIPLSHGA